jgi:hypothetical protein
MASSAIGAAAARPTVAVTASSRVPAAIYAVLFASTSVVIGVIWDISWHRTIGRDTFWTPAHLAIYLGGIVSGLTCGWLALKTTFAGTAEERDETVRFWGFRAPFGAWVSIWGAIAMLTSAPFDDWWHNAYGLDVKIISPPHMVLAAGIAAIQSGAMLMALAAQNRAGEAERRRFGWLFLYGAGLLLLLAATISIENTQRWDMHRSGFYRNATLVFVFFLVSAARASVARWPATTTALIYTAVLLIMVWLLPQFPGQPLLGPIYVQVDRFMPPPFPLLLVVPAVAIDLLMRWRRSGRGHDWLLAGVIAVVFLLTFIAVQWPFANFLVSEWARNDFVGSHRMDYNVLPQIQARWYRLNAPDNLLRGLSIALAFGFVSARLGLWWGNWMARVQR